RRLLGGGGLHPRTGPGGMDIGYWVRASSARQGIAAEAAAALTRVGIEICKADRIEIHVDPGNEASLGVPRKLGFTEEATLRRGSPRRRRTILARRPVDGRPRDRRPVPVSRDRPPRRRRWRGSSP